MIILFCVNFYKKSSGKNPEDFFSPYLTLADEATAYIDPENEALVQKAISTLTVGKTLVVIAHRQSTIVGADNIVVVKDGTIHAQGTHEKLLETCPLYRDMWQAHIGAKDQM